MKNKKFMRNLEKMNFKILSLKILKNFVVHSNEELLTNKYFIDNGMANNVEL